MSNNASTRKMTFFIAFPPSSESPRSRQHLQELCEEFSLRHHPSAYNKNESQLREYSFSGRVGIRNGSLCVCFHGKSRDHVMRQVAPLVGEQCSGARRGKGQSRLPVFRLSDRRSS